MTNGKGSMEVVFPELGVCNLLCWATLPATINCCLSGRLLTDLVLLLRDVCGWHFVKDCFPAFVPLDW